MLAANGQRKPAVVPLHAPAGACAKHRVHRAPRKGHDDTTRSARRSDRGRCSTWRLLYAWRAPTPRSRFALPAIVQMLRAAQPNTTRATLGRDRA